MLVQHSPVVRMTFQYQSLAMHAVFPTLNSCSVVASTASCFFNMNQYHSTERPAAPRAYISWHTQPQLVLQQRASSETPLHEQFSLFIDFPMFIDGRFPASFIGMVSHQLLFYPVSSGLSGKVWTSAQGNIFLSCAFLVLGIVVAPCICYSSVLQCSLYFLLTYLSQLQSSVIVRKPLY